MTRIALIGNPNSGKTTLFNALTGAHQRVGNWPGVTVERKTGALRHGGSEHELVDLPGIYSLINLDASEAIDERIARDYLLDAEVDAIINVVDASSLARGLFLTSQLLDLETPVILVLNMMDVADRHGVHIDPYRLSTLLGCPVVPIVASRREGIGTLKDVLTNQMDRPTAHTGLQLPAELDRAIEQCAATLRSQGLERHTRFHATALLDGDHDTVRRSLGREPSPPLDPMAPDLLSVARYQRIDELLSGALRTTPVRRTVTDVLDAVLLNRLLAVPAFLAVMYLMFMFTINVGSAFIDFFDLSAQALFVEGPRQIYQALNLPAWLTAFLADGVGGGVQLVATFIPVIGCLFLFLSFLEDSGYMGRAAFIIDRLMKQLGLPGKSFVPLIVGFGCNVPAVMATRSLDNEQDRILTTIMAPFMSCGARLTVYALFAVTFFRGSGQNVVFGLYLLGIVVAVLSALIVRRFLLSRENSTFVMELPAYHLPTLRGLVLHTWNRLKGFVMRAGKAIVAVVIVLNVVNSVGTDGSFGNQDTDKSALSAIGRALTPAFGPMGIEERNWPATVGIFTGIFAKEVVVGTLDSLYGSLAGADQDQSTPAFDLAASLGAAWATIPANLSALAGQVTDPLGLDLGDLEDVESQAQAQSVSTRTIATMRASFGSELAAFAYLVFVLLYIPCVATVGVIYKELGGFWATFSTAWSLIMAYTLAVQAFQIGQLSETPATAGPMIGAMVAVQLLGFASLIRWGRRHQRRTELIALVNLS